MSKSNEPKKKEDYQKILRILLIVNSILLVIHILFILCLPNVVPLRWNNEGSVELYGSKWLYFILDVLPFITIWLFYLPGKSNSKPTYIFTPAWRYFCVSFNILMTLATWIPEYLVFTKTESLPTAIAKSQGGLMLLIGIMFLFLGNFLPQVSHNHSFGVKTPWTKDDKLNWKKTNHLFSVFIMIIGMVCIIASLFYSSWIRLLGIIGLGLTLMLYGYSFYLFYKKQ